MFDTKKSKDHSNPLDKHTERLYQAAQAHRECGTHPTSPLATA